MAGTLLEKRELYIDVAVKEAKVEEIFLYQVDFYRNQTFRTKEFLYKKEDVEEIEGEGASEEQPAPPEPLELFKEQWEQLMMEDVSTELYATDAAAVLEYIFSPLKNKNAAFKAKPEIQAGREFIHDCISMGRVVSMSAFDEEQYLSASIRKRMKERYHEYMDKMKENQKEHIFIRQTEVDDVPVMLLLITDEKYTLKKQVMLQCAVKEETLAVRFREILSLHPAGDILIDGVTPELYRLFRNMNRFMGMEEKRQIFSIESMLCALGKTPDCTELIKTYLLYIKNQEEMRRGSFKTEHLYSMHSFYLPAQISSEKAWYKQFAKNSVWKQAGRECYAMEAEGELKGKYIVKAGREQFVLKLCKVAVQRYLKKYAVIRVDVENYCYPGEEDRKRIHELAADLFVGMEKRAADCIEIKIKNKEQAYSLAAVLQNGNTDQLWLNGLFLLGKEKQKKGLVLTAIKEQMYCVETKDLQVEEQIIQNALIRDGIFRKIEDALAKAMKPESNDRPFGALLKSQKRQIKELFEMYRYIVVAFSENYESAQKNGQKQLWQDTMHALGTAEVEERLKSKFALFF